MKIMKTRVNFGHCSILLFADLAFDAADGVYVQLWEAFYAPAIGSDIRRSELQSADIGALPYEDFITLAEELTELCYFGIKTYYDDLEAEYIDQLKSRTGR